MSALFRHLLENHPRPKSMPSFPHPNSHPFAIRWRDSPVTPVPVSSGPLTTYRCEIPVPGQEGGPPLWESSPTITSPSCYNLPPITPNENAPQGDLQPDQLASPLVIPSPIVQASKTYLSRATRGLPPFPAPPPTLSDFNWMESAPRFPCAPHSSVRAMRCGRYYWWYPNAKFFWETTR